MVELLTGWLNNLKNADHVGVTTQIYNTVKEADINNDMYKTAAKALEKAIGDEDEAYRKTLKDWTVEELKATDAEQDGLMKCIRSVLAGHAALPDGQPTKQKAKELLLLWREYDFRLNDSYSGEAAKVINMYQDVERRKADAEEIGIWKFFEEAKRKAEEIQRLLDERFVGLASRDVGEMRKARGATDTVVKQLYQMLEALQAFAASDALTELVRKLRAIEDYARVYYLKSSASSAENSPEGGTGDGDGGDAGEDSSGTPPWGGD